MNRPYIFCHMLTSLDGKIMGNYMDLPACEPAGDLFYDIAFGEDPFYRHQGWLSGRVTTDDNFTHYRAPALTPGAPTVPEGDFVAQQAPMYYVSVDPKGKLGWESATLTYETTTAHVIEVLTEEASNDYKAFLRKLGISYILAGKDRLDYALALEKLKTRFGIQVLMLGGGGGAQLVLPPGGDVRRGEPRRGPRRRRQPQHPIPLPGQGGAEHRRPPLLHPSGGGDQRGQHPLAAVPGQLWAGHPGPLTPASHSNL